MKVIILMSIAIIALQSQAGGSVNNGGSGVYCDNKQEVELFDYFEARTLRGIQIDLGGNNLNYMEKVKLALSRIKNLDPFYYNKFTIGVEHFLSETKFISNANLTPIPDIESPVLPIDCHIKQIAIQKLPLFPGDSYFLIDQNLWDRMSEDSKAGLVLHEIIYRQILHETSQTTSLRARYLNALISSKSIEKFKVGDYNQILHSVGLWAYTIYQDKASRIVWIDAREFGSSTRASATCETEFPGSRIPREDELEKAYPSLGLAIGDLIQIGQGISNHFREQTIWLIDSQTQQPELVTLTPFSYAKSTWHPTGLGSVYCVLPMGK